MSHSSSESDLEELTAAYSPDHPKSIAAAAAISDQALPLPDETDPEFVQLRSYLSVLLSMPGTSRAEVKVVRHIGSVMRSFEFIQPEHVNSSWRRHGVYCLYVPPEMRGETVEIRDAVLFGAHTDIVRHPSEMIEPEFLDDPRRTVRATGLDNRLSCAVLLNLLHFAESNEFKRPMAVYFSVQEEIGYLGCRHFVTRMSLLKQHNFQVSEVYVIDATFGRWADASCEICPTFTLKNGLTFDAISLFDDFEAIPPIGNGCVPFTQSFGLSDPKQNSGLTDMAPFVRSESEYKEAKKECLAVPVIDMHHSQSFASMNDIYELYRRCRDYMMGKPGCTLLVGDAE